jgi:hypothetical protein
MRILTFFVFLFVNHAFAQTLEEKFKQQQSQINGAPRSEVLAEVLQLWRTLERECNWYHVGPKNFTESSLRTPFSFFMNTTYILNKDSNGWSFDPRTSLPESGLPFICIYQNAVWGSDAANEWRGRKFICDNQPAKSVTRQIVVPYVYAKLDDKWTANMKLRSDFRIDSAGILKAAQYEINFKNNTCFYEYENKVDQCKLVPIDKSRISSRFMINIAYATSEAIRHQCGN